MNSYGPCYRECINTKILFKGNKSEIILVNVLGLSPYMLNEVLEDLKKTKNNTVYMRQFGWHCFAVKIVFLLIFSFRTN